MKSTFTTAKTTIAVLFAMVFLTTRAHAQVSAGALNLDGINDHIEVPSVNILNLLPLTIEAWVRPEVRNDGTSVSQYYNNVISNDLPGSYGTGIGAVVLNNGSSAVIVAYNDGMRYITGTPLTAGTWYHIAAVYTPGNVKTYLNGTLVDNHNFSQNYNNSTAIIRIGKLNDDISQSTKRFFKGDIDEVRIWNRALCRGEILNNMNCELALPQSNLFAYYRFNQGLIGLPNITINTLIDSSGNGYNGTFYNFAMQGASSNCVAGKASGTCNSFTVPPATITAAGSTSICQGDSVLLTANTANAYQWYNFGVAIAGATNQIYYAKQTGQYTVAVTTGNCTITSAARAVTVNSKPSIFISASSTSICAGLPVFMSISGSNNAQQAASFNTVNTNDYISIPHQSQLSSAVVTVEAWVRPGQGNKASGIIMKLPAANSGQTGFGIRQSAGNTFQFVIGDEGNQSYAESYPFTAGQWYHITGTYDGFMITIYVNGSQEGTGFSFAGNINTTVPVIVGNNNTMTQPYKGAVDELRIWNVVNSGQQISCNYRASVSPASTGLTGYWKCNTVSNGTTPDATSYQNNGVVMNTTSLIASMASVGSDFKWLPVPGFTDTNNACVTVYPTATTTYTGIATNAAGCISKDSVTITVFPSGQAYNVTGGGTYCVGGPGVPVGLSGSQVGIFYQLKKGASNIGGLVAGTGSPMTVGYATQAGVYSVVAVNSNCTNTMSGSVIVTAYNSPAINVTSISHPACYGLSTGSIDVLVNNGAQPYVYNWSNNATTEDIYNIPAGNYMLNVTDANGCTTADTFAITQPTPPIVSATVNNVSCNGQSNGGITLATGGVPPYSFSWSNGANTKDINNLVAGTYYISVTDATGCKSDSSYTVTQPGVLNVVANALNVTCQGNNNDGAVNLTVTGGTAPYTYLWNTGATTKNLSSLLPGTYSVSVVDANGCTASATATVGQPAGVAISGVVSDVKCYGANDGSIDVTPTSGQAPFSYSWSNGSTAEDPVNLAPGTYTVDVADFRNCVASASFTVSQSATPMAASITHTNIACNGATTGTASTVVSGGTAPYIYSWSNGATTPNISGVSAGNYTVAITDAKGCVQNLSANITQPTAMAITEVISNTICGSNVGAIDLTVSGGTAPYTYSWSNGAVTEDISSLASGSYTVTVADANGCTKTKQFNIASSSLINITGVTTNIACHGGNAGNIALSVSGGISPYSYQWNDNVTTPNRSQLTAGNYTVTVTDGRGCSESKSFNITQPTPVAVTNSITNPTCHSSSNGGSINNGSINLTVSGGTGAYTYLWSNNATTQNISGLGGGTYTVQIADANGCLKTDSFTVTEPPAINMSGVITHVSTQGASNGAVDVTVSGGAPPYSYEWNIGDTTQDISNLPVGFYSLIVTDSKGCSVNDFYEVLLPTCMTITSVKTDVSCRGGSNGAIDISINGGTAPYTYSWTGGASTQDISGLAPGVYQVIVTDATGCSATDSFEITQPYTVLTVSSAVTHPTCHGGGSDGAINLTVSGGDIPYTYNWGNGITTKNSTNISGGIYTVSVTDANGCVKTKTDTLNHPAGNFIVNGTVTNIPCYGDSTGTINLNISGGAAPYTYQWSDGNTNNNRNNLKAGTYTVTVTDAIGCTVSKSFNITQPTSGITLSASITNVSCYGGDNGAIDLSVTGGAGNYTYNWNLGNNNCWWNWWSWWMWGYNNQSTNQDVNNLDAGVYTVTVTDANGCTATATYTITEPTAINITATVNSPSCNNGNNGSINLNVSGGTGSYSYSWSNGSNWSYHNNNVTAKNRSNLSAGNYTVKVTDGNGCNKTKTITVTEPTAISGNISVSPAVTVTNGQPYTIYLGYGAQSVTLTANANGGTPGYTYQWSSVSGVSNPTSAATSVSPSTTTTYYVTITDANGCTKTLSKTIRVEDVSCGNGKNPKVKICHNGNTICVSANAVPAHLAHGCSLGECEDYNWWWYWWKSGNNDNEEEQDNITSSHSAISNVTANDAIKVYPNPSTGNFVIELPQGKNDADILITDMHGKLVERRTVNGVQSVNFNLGQVAQGMYMIQVMSDGEKYNSRITIQ